MGYSFITCYITTFIFTLLFSNLLDAKVSNVISTILRYYPLLRHRSGVLKNYPIGEIHQISGKYCDKYIYMISHDGLGLDMIFLQRAVLFYARAFAWG